MRVGKQILKTALLSTLIFTCLIGVAVADSSSSTNYRVDETMFGIGGELNACSTAYCTKQAAGELGVGNAASANYQAQGGFNTDRTPFIEFTVTGGTTDVGLLTSSSTATTTRTFSVKNYLSNGYVVRTVSDPPQNNSYTLTGLSSPTASAINTEQFGINLVANTSPSSFGANPSQAPDASFGFGAAASGYDTANLFKYVKGDIVAESAKSSGTTTYTISYIFNITNTTPGGAYIFNHVLVATATY